MNGTKETVLKLISILLVVIMIMSRYRTSGTFQSTSCYGYTYTEADGRLTGHYMEAMRFTPPPMVGRILMKLIGCNDTIIYRLSPAYGLDAYHTYYTLKNVTSMNKH